MRPCSVSSPSSPGRTPNTAGPTLTATPIRPDDDEAPHRVPCRPAQGFVRGCLGEPSPCSPDQASVPDKCLALAQRAGLMTRDSHGASHMSVTDLLTGRRSTALLHHEAGH